MSEDTVTLRGPSFEVAALNEPPDYAMPLAHLASNRKPFEYFWRLANFVFRLPSPYGFPVVPELEGNEVLRRYCDCARELATSAVIEVGASVSINVNRDSEGRQVERVVSSFPSKELIRGFLVLFRQVFSNKEPASFMRVRSLLFHAARTDSRIDERILKAWVRAHGQLRAHVIQDLVGIRLTEEGRLGEFPRHQPPELLINMFAYGDYIHWDRNKEVVARWRADAFDGPWNELAFLQAVTGLSFLYMGFAVIAAGAVNRTDLTPAGGA